MDRIIPVELVITLLVLVFTFLVLVFLGLLFPSLTLVSPFTPGVCVFLTPLLVFVLRMLEVFVLRTLEVFVFFTTLEVFVLRMLEVFVFFTTLEVFVFFTTLEVFVFFKSLEVLVFFTSLEVLVFLTTDPPLSKLTLPGREVTAGGEGFGLLADRELGDGWPGASVFVTVTVRTLCSRSDSEAEQAGKGMWAHLAKLISASELIAGVRSNQSSGAENAQNTKGQEFGRGHLGYGGVDLGLKNSKEKKKVWGEGTQVAL